MSLAVLLLIVVSVTLSALAQISLKAGMASLAAGAHGGPAGIASGLHSILLALGQPWVLVGLALYGLGAMVWMLVLARLDVSVAYPFVALGFIVVMLLGALFFGEALTLAKLSGTLLVGAGVWLIARG
jgi:multidrug transporter EmrE-like cation transporter